MKYTITYNTTGKVIAISHYDILPTSLEVGEYEATENQALNPSIWTPSANGLIESTDAQTQLLAQAQAKQKSLIETAYQNAITAPIAYMSTSFQADNASQDILVKVLVGMQVAGATPSGFAWLDANNVGWAMTLADLQGLYGAILTRGQVEFAKRLVAKNAINVAATVVEVEAVVL